MLHIKPKKSKRGFHVRVHTHEGVIHEVFIGTRTLILFLGFSIGGVMVGRSFWEYGIRYLGLNLTTLAGILLFTTTGVILHKFRKK